MSNIQRNYTKTEKEIIAIVKCLKQLSRILFGYKINLFSDHKNMVYTATLSEYQRVTCWQLILKEFGPNFKHTVGFGTIVDNTLSRLPSTSVDKYKTCTRKAKCNTNELSEIIMAETNEDCFPLNLLIVQREKRKEMRSIH